MSILSNKERGGKGSSYSFHHKVLLGLQRISDLLSSPSAGTNTPAVVRTPIYKILTSNTSTPSGVQSLSLWYIGTGGELDGSPVKYSTRLDFQPTKSGDTLSSMLVNVPTTGDKVVVMTYVI